MLDQIKSLIQNREEDAIIQKLEEAPYLLDKTDEKGSSVLLLLAYNGLQKAFKVAKQLKMNLGFYEAIVCGEKEQVKQQLTKFPGLENRHSGDGFTPLSLAAFFNQTAIALLLLDHGADPNLAATNPSEVNALHSAVARGNYELCQRILKKGAEVNKPQAKGVTPLHAAAHRGDLELVKLLVNHGAHIDLKMETGETAIDMAERDGHTDVSVFLWNNIA